MPNNSATKSRLPDYGSVRARSRAAWRSWLERHHTVSSGVWLVMAKKHTGLATVAYNDAVEEALCFGWIDTTLNPIDSRFYKQLFTPRKPRSTWAATNKARVERLIAQKLMTAAGLAVIAAAKANGSWSSIDDVEAGKVPEDLQKAIAGSAVATHAWSALRPGRRKQFLFWMSSAKRQSTRDARIAEILDRLNGDGPGAGAKGPADTGSKGTRPTPAGSKGTRPTAAGSKGTRPSSGNGEADRKAVRPAAKTAATGQRRQR